MSAEAGLVLQVEDLVVDYYTRQGNVQARQGVSFEVREGRALGLVGESGCGKTTVAMAIMGILPENGSVTGGAIRIDGADLAGLSESQMRPYRWDRVSMVFQAAMSSLNPVHRVGDQVIEAIQAHESVRLDEARERTAGLFEVVDLDPALMDRYPHELSGGMKQRVVIAMALACHPDVVIADEPTTALDVIVQDRILKQLSRIQGDLNMAMIYISHDIAVIAEVCDDIGVMYAGKLVELAPAEALFENAGHPYTEALLSSSLSVRGERHDLTSLPGEPPDLLDPPTGCPFHPRCAYATERCSVEMPGWEMRGAGHGAACWHPLGSA